MKIHAFMTFILAIALLFFQIFAYFQHHFSGVDSLKSQVAALQGQLKAEKLNTLVAQHETTEIQQTVATLMPNAIKDTKDPLKNYSLRNLASVVDEPDSQGLNIERASSLFEQAKEEFREKNYPQSIQLLSALIEEYPDSVHVIEAQFLLAEASFLIKDEATSVKTIELMMARYPENILTGFALVRLAQIYQENDRIEDAAEVLRTVINTYSDPGLLRQAQISLKALDL